MSSQDINNEASKSGSGSKMGSMDKNGSKSKSDKDENMKDKGGSCGCG